MAFLVSATLLSFQAAKSEGLYRNCFSIAANSKKPPFVWSNPISDFRYAGKTKWVVGVEVYSSSKAMVGELAAIQNALPEGAADVRMIYLYRDGSAHVSGTKEAPVISVQGDQLNAVVDELLQIPGFTGVVTGGDAGVDLSVELRRLLHKKNPGQFSWDIREVKDHHLNELRQRALRDKAAQLEILKLFNIPHADFFSVQSFEQALMWVQKKGYLKNGRHLVVKPLESASGEDVVIVKDEQQLRKALEILGNENKHGQKNSSALLMEYLPGFEEYSVDVSTTEGASKLVSIFRLKKRPNADGSRVIYGSSELLPENGEAESALHEYALRVIQAFGIHNGLDHIEIKFVPGRGPILVELNHRLAGGGMADLVRHATGFHQSYDILRQATGLSFPVLPMKYHLKKTVGQYDLALLSPGKYRARPDFIARIKHIHGYIGHLTSVSGGQFVPQTVDLKTAVATINVEASSPEELERIYEQIRSYEQSNYFWIPDGSIPVSHSTQPQSGEAGVDESNFASLFHPLMIF